MVFPAIKYTLHVLEAQSPNAEFPAAANGLSFQRIVRHDVLVIGETVREDRHRLMIRMRNRPEYEIRLARDSHPITRAESHLRLYLPGQLAHFQIVAVFPVAENILDMVRPGFLTNGLHEAKLQLAIKERIHRDIIELTDFLDMLFP